LALTHRDTDNKPDRFDDMAEASSSNSNGSGSSGPLHGSVRGV
jgi:hypothetical protein